MGGISRSETLGLPATSGLSKDLLSDLHPCLGSLFPWVCQTVGVTLQDGIIGTQKPVEDLWKTWRSSAPLGTKYDGFWGIFDDKLREDKSKKSSKLLGKKEIVRVKRN